MTSARSSPHPFTPGRGLTRDALGRAMHLCTVCGKVGRGSGHRGYRSRPIGTGAAPATPAERPGEPARLVPHAPVPARKVADWRLHFLRHAVELVSAAHLELEPLTEIRLHELERALRSELYGTAQAGELEHRPEEPPTATRAVEPAPEPVPIVAPLASATARRLLHSIRSDKHRELVRRAIAGGWRADRTGTGHIALYPPGGGSPIVVSGSAGAGRGHGWYNLRAQASRLGLDVAGL